MEYMMHIQLSIHKRTNGKQMVQIQKKTRPPLQIYTTQHQNKEQEDPKQDVEPSYSQLHLSQS